MLKSVGLLSGRAGIQLQVCLNPRFIVLSTSSWSLSVVLLFADTLDLPRLLLSMQNYKTILYLNLSSFNFKRANFQEDTRV